MKTSEKILQTLKIKGPQTAKVLADELALTTMGVRQHLQGLEESGDVVFEDKKALRGRPTRYWSLTTQSNSHFSDRHPELTVQLIDSVKTIFGDEGLEQLIEHRELASLELYLAAMKKKDSLLDKLSVLEKLRTDEGYMASIEQEGDIFWLLENHCPICAAASQCLNFCRSELQLFQRLFEGIAAVSREEHIIEGARRCAYKVVPV
ncbi:helix-turn-helix transcriptional regulator [Shewanella surugensis]|uniref:Transcriptional regulator n=1 Tax=Shewanella surugensis TaxID=212020 RepID=A0ABT0L7W9_9GAMM|nr:metalloregulator ArsR/SmtB family transcription factor [Shewanella surugensis]MCL1123788.1 transcriptional regulator [Shewanella surugensis]